MGLISSRRRSVLITGASGHLGLLLVKALSELDWKIYAVSRKNSFINFSNVTHIPHEWSKPIAFEIPDVDTIFHLAAQTSAYKARENVEEDLATNVLGTVRLLEKVAKSNIRPAFIFTGSMTEYGLAPTGAIDENAPVSPQTFYDSAKLAIEIYLGQYVMEGWLSKSVTLRLSNVYGNISLRQGVDRGFLDRSIVRALKGEPLIYFGSGQYLRDFIHVNDVIRALVESALQIDDLNLSVFNIGTGFSTSIKSALDFIANEAKLFTGIQVEINQADFDINSYAIERRNSTANSRAFHELTGWKPKVSFESGVRMGLKEAMSLVSPS